MRTAALLLAAWTLQAQGAQALAQEAAGGGTVVLEGAGYRFTAAPADAGGGAFRLREEVTSPALIASLGGRAATVELSVDCSLHQSSIRDVRVFTAAPLQGEGAPVKAVAWLRSLPVDLIDLNMALCGSPQAPSAPLPEASSPSLDTPPPASAPVSATTPPPKDRTAATPAAPGRWVQLGAFASEALAQAQWTQLAAASGELKGHGHRLEPVQRGASRLVRLLGGPYASKAAAEDACAGLRRSGVACLVR